MGLFGNPRESDGYCDYCGTQVINTMSQFDGDLNTCSKCKKQKKEGLTTTERMVCQADECSRKFTEKLTKRAIRNGAVEVVCPGCGFSFDVAVEWKG